MVWRQFFERYGKYEISVDYFESSQSASVEALYQAFKERFREEPPLTREERIAQLRAEIDWLLASDSDGRECD